MKKNYKFFIPFIVMIIVSITSIVSAAQPDPPPLPEQHGYSGNQSIQSAPLDGGTEVLIPLGIFYLAIKLAGRKRNIIAAR
jgi:hypothetical protein